MKRPMSIVLAVAIVCIGILVTLRAQERPAERSPQKWQHMALTHRGADVGSDPQLAKQINEVGEKGWELVSTLNTQEQGQTTSTIFFFKRPK